MGLGHGSWSEVSCVPHEPLSPPTSPPSHILESRSPQLPADRPCSRRPGFISVCSALLFSILGTPRATRDRGSYGRDRIEGEAPHTALEWGSAWPAACARTQTYLCKYINRDTRISVKHTHTRISGHGSVHGLVPQLPHCAVLYGIGSHCTASAVSSLESLTPPRERSHISAGRTGSVSPDPVPGGHLVPSFAMKH